MPELPEVQTIVNDLIAAGLTGRTITRTKVYWPATIATPPVDRFCRRLRGRTILHIRRRAKLILLELDSGEMLAVHLRMTGRFQWDDAVKPRSKHIHVMLTIDDGRTLCFHDTRKFGRFYLVEDPQTLLGKLGPEPLAHDFSVARFQQQLVGRNRQIKPLLLDQTFLAGLGNIYVDEALWAARIHPLRRADTLTPDEVKRLHAAIRHVLRQGVKHAGTTLGRGPSNFYSLNNTRGGNEAHLKVFRRTGAPCERCRGIITRIIVAQRSTHLCEQCQPRSGSEL